MKMAEESKNTASEQYFDKDEAYTEEVVPVMEQLQKVCEKHGLPHLVWVIFSEDEKRVGQGILMNTSFHESAAGKMKVLGNIADGTIPLEHLGIASLLFRMLKNNKED